ncbi:CBS domain-containing protein [Aquibium sp. A9E412]|uniref:CBS domain-containing protein n=1 Tax=Aquibium sp. A9E412 TaxID=2976767 RepID=UPI0025B19218|nr:CBS domain-containing protein [Aquibium sp. A9E412]MDN2565558.1 CBS domain-containing protein [Aquibium sp. A9E412]
MLQARDVMTREVVTVQPQTPVREVAQRLVERRISAVPVVDGDGRLVGIVSEGDLMRRPETGAERRRSWWLFLVADAADQARDYVKTHGTTAADVMTRDVVAVAEDTDLAEIATLLERNRIKRVPVLTDGRLVGIVSRANLLHGLVAATGGARSEAAPSGDDLAVRQALEEAIAETGVRREFLNMVVSDGVAQIWGAVESAAEKQAVQVAAERTAGITRVENNVGVLSPMVRSVLWAE